MTEFQTLEQIINHHKNVEVTYENGKPVRVLIIDSKHVTYGSTWDRTYHLIYRLTPEPHQRWVGREEQTGSWANS